MSYSELQELRAYPENQHGKAFRILHAITMLGYTLVQIKCYVTLNPEDKEYKRNSLETLNNLQRELSNLRVSIDLIVGKAYSEPTVYLRIYELYARALQMEANEIQFSYSKDLGQGYV